jgi:CARDB
VTKFLSVSVSALAIAGAVLSIAAFDANAAAKKRYVPKPAVPATPIVVVPAGPGPDIVVLPDQTEMTVGGCGVNDELITGTVGVRNQGKDRADRLIVEPIVSVYVPEMLDMKDDKLVPNSLSPKEIFSTDVHIGKGKIKAGRGLVGVRKVYIVVDPYNKINESNEQNNLLVRELKFDCK